MAGLFNDLKIPDRDEDLFLKTIERLPVWGADTQILDLGCGAERYSIDSYLTIVWKADDSESDFKCYKR